MSCHEWLKTVADAAAHWYADGMKTEGGQIGCIDRKKIVLTLGVILFKPEPRMMYSNLVEDAFASLQPRSLFPLSRFCNSNWSPRQMLMLDPNDELNGLSTRQLGEFLCAPKLHPVVAVVMQNMLADRNSGLHLTYLNMHSICENPPEELLASVGVGRILVGT